MKKNKKNPLENFIPDIASVASANECTGLMPAPPIDDYEEVSYFEIYSLPIKKRAASPNLHPSHDNS